MSRAHSKAAAIKMVEEPTAAAIDIRADYVAKNGVPSAAAPKIFFRYYYVNSSTGEKSGVMLAETTWTAGAYATHGPVPFSRRTLLAEMPGGFFVCMSELCGIFVSINVCHEKKSCWDGHLAGGLRNFERDGGRPTAYGMQVLFANHFVRLEGKLTGRERQMEG